MASSTAVTFLSVTLAHVILRLRVVREIIGFLSVTDTSLGPRPFFAGEEKRRGTMCLIISRKVGIPDIFGLYSHT